MTKEKIYLSRASNLIDEVHRVLGYTRSGLDRLDGATQLSPLLGGLRIGKNEPEDHPDGDGQYFHYLTKWMFALNRMSVATGDVKYNSWAVELAKSVHSRFVFKIGSGEMAIHWKMRIDLSAPLVPSMGNLDAFDGYVTYRILDKYCRNIGQEGQLMHEIGEMYSMVLSRYRNFHSSDPLDLGEALWMAHWFSDSEEWAKTILARSLESLEFLWNEGYFLEIRRPFRLAFREFGTTLGLQCLEYSGSPESNSDWSSRIALLHTHWNLHLFERDTDITPLMFGSSLVPGVWHRGFFSPPAPIE
jgi:hypothetical protein